jgi:hypothetical protein
MFLDLPRLMGNFGDAVMSCLKCDGLIIDLRGNPGGIGGMAMGMAGYLVDDAGKQLGTMYIRDTKLKFVINPRANVFHGPVAILMDGNSASTSEIMAGGLKDIGRARVFGTRSAAAALPSLIERLPNGDGFQYAIANYISEGGKPLEGLGVTPDVEVKLTREALLAGHDPVVDAALEWIKNNESRKQTMIRRTAIAILLGSASLAWAADEALPKAESILDRFVEVTGGKAAYEKRKTEIVTGTFAMPAQGLKGTFTRYAAEPDKSYLAMEFEGIGKMEQGTSGGVAWDKNPMTGPRVKSGEEKTQGMREAAFNEPIHWRKLYSKAETTGVETIDGDECYKVVMTPLEGKPETRYFSKKSGLVAKTAMTAVSPMGEVEVEALPSAYKDFGGIKMPTKTVMKQAGQEFVLTFESVKANEELPADRFEPPAEIKALLAKPAEKK